MHAEIPDRPTEKAGRDFSSVGANRRAVWRRPWVTGFLTGAAIVAAAGVGIAVMSVAIREILLEDLRMYLQRTAESTAALIDAREHGRMTIATSTDDPQYLTLVAPLRALLRTNPDIRFAYSGLVRGDTMLYVLDGDTSSQQAHVMERDVPTDGEREVARTGKTVVERRPSPTAWGSGIRAYAPLAKTEDGSHAYVGITIDAERYNEWLRRVFAAAALGWVAAASIALLVGLRAARAERRRESAEADMAAMRDAALAASEERHALEQRLQGRQKMEALGTLAGGVAHDFNNLLTVILGHAELLGEETERGTEIHESAQSIRTAATRARDVVRRILLFARPEMEHRSALSLGPVIDETVQLLRSTLPSSVEIVWSAPATAVMAIADAVQITQILMNLGVNASQALRDQRGAMKISLDTVRLTDVQASPLVVAPGTYARIRVHDDGVGMSEEVRRRIFEPFFTTKSADQGTGLGLSIVEGVVRGHQGAVEVESSPGAGATFTIYLPAPERLPRVPSQVPSPPSETEPPNGKRLMLVDDDVQVLRTVTKVLIRAGYQVDAFDDARKALHALELGAARYEVLITDRTMPGMSGLELAQRAHELRAALPAVLLSGALQEGDRDAARFAEVVGKPPEAAALLAAIGRAAGRAVGDPT